jgi:putative membrane protein
MPYWQMGYIGWFWDILFWILLIWLIVWLISKNRSKTKSPVDVLKLRYARGEINKKEFDAMKKDIQ